MADGQTLVLALVAGVVCWVLAGAMAEAPRFVRLHLDEKAQKLLIVNTASIAAVLPEKSGNGGSWVFVSGARTFEVHEPPEAIAAMMR